MGELRSSGRGRASERGRATQARRPTRAVLRDGQANRSRPLKVPIPSSIGIVKEELLACVDGASGEEGRERQERALSSHGNDDEVRQRGTTVIWAIEGQL